MKNVTAKTGVPLTYSINSIDGQLIGLYWEYSWEILDNQDGTSDQKGQILNENYNSNKVFITWLRKTATGEVFTVKCHVKIKPTATVCNCERDVFINVIVSESDTTLSDNVVLTEDITYGSSQCKIYNSINYYKACCIGAKKIKWIVQGGHIILDPSNLNSTIGNSAIKDTTNSCNSISIIWDVKNASKYSVTAYGINESKISSGTTIIEKIVGVDTIVPIITGDSIVTIGEDLTAAINYTLSEFNWSSFPTSYTLNIWFQLGTLLAGSINSSGISDDDYSWSTIYNLAGGSINYYISQTTKIFSKTINIPASYDTNTPTKYRFKLINIEIVGPNEILDCYVSSNGRGVKGVGYSIINEYNNDISLIYCPSSANFPLPPLDKIINPSCSETFVLGDVDIVVAGCSSNIILGILRPCKKPLPQFDDIVITSIYPTFDRICFNYCVPPSLEFDTCCITICIEEEPKLGQLGTINGIKFDCCWSTIPEFDDSPGICNNVCDTFLPEFGSISYYKPEIPIFNPIPGKLICYLTCTFDTPEFGSTLGVDAICISECYSNSNITIIFDNILGGENVTPELGDGTTYNLITFECQYYPSISFDVSPTICITLCSNDTPSFENISIYGNIIPEFSKYYSIGFRDCTSFTTEFGSTVPDNICYSTQIMSDIGFYQLPCYCVTPTLEFGYYLTLSCQTLSTPTIDSDYPNNITLCCQFMSTIEFTKSSVPGYRLCNQIVDNTTA